LRKSVALSSPSPANLTDRVTAAEQGSLGVQLHHLVREIAVREVERARAGHLPTVDLVATVGSSHRPASATLPRTESATLGVQLNVPLFAGGAIASRAREAVALQTKAELDLEGARRDAALAARQAYLGVTSGLARIK